MLLDVARHRKVKYLAPLSVISPEELDDVAKAQGVSIESGDIVLIRTGWRARFLETHNGEAWLQESPGLSWRCAEWLHNKRAAAVASDNIAVECVASEFTDAFLVFHMLTLRDMGMMLGEIWDLEALGADCAADEMCLDGMCRRRPDAGALVESELWPNLIRAARRRGVPLALVNARFSERSSRRWRRRQPDGWARYR